MENEIISKMREIKDILLNKVKTFDDYNNNKDKIIVTIEEIEKMLFEIFKEKVKVDYLKDNKNDLNNEFEKISEKEENKNLYNVNNEENGNNEDNEKEFEGEKLSDKDEIINKRIIY